MAPEASASTPRVHAVLGRPEFGLDASAGWSGGAGGLSGPLAVAGACVKACVCRANDS